MLVKTNRVLFPTYQKSTFRIPMISSLCSAPHDKKDNDVERSPSETLFIEHSSQRLREGQTHQYSGQQKDNSKTICSLLGYSS